MPSMVTCITWFSRGVAKTVPDKVELSQGELEQLINETIDKIKAKEGDEYNEDKLNTEISNLQYRDQEQSDNSDNEENTILQEYDFDNYDDEGEGVVLTGAGMAGLTYFLNNDDDPYITLKNSVYAGKYTIHTAIYLLIRHR
ncbi:periodic tryptophan protein 1 homolog [Xenia sp. Carnegie-2017]|uniref:periodic tryptophan protein 1 homolog n=1 Tax=Xenia sp. Carnegie-2017 TaxID=2897299 RepID=UPI001F048C5A|nr:periodic tryptophan protein 1 homolog [Xenia sp. Carnegie-2017]